MEERRTTESKCFSIFNSLTYEDQGRINTSAMESKEEVLSESEAKRIQRKIDLHLMPPMALICLIQFIDKSTLNFAAILGLLQSTKLTAEEYNWLSTIFFIAYFVFQLPQNLALQRFPIGAWIGLNCFIWAVALGAQAACKNFTQLMVCRFILGACEGSVIPGFMLVTAMFYTQKEQSVRTGYWFIMSGLSQIISGFMAYFTLKNRNNIKIPPWKFYFILNSSFTLLASIISYLMIPSNPKKAWFLTKDEKYKAILRVKINETKVEDKKFRIYQVKEAIKDFKTWVWFIFCVLVAIPSSLSAQVSIIVVTFGYTVRETTLLTCGFGLISIISMWVGVELIDRVKNSRGLIGAIWYIASTVGAILIIELPWGNRVGLLIAIYLATLCSTPFVVVLGWIVSTTAGYTKRLIVQAIILTGYCFGNIIGPQMWRSQYKPRNKIPWTIIIICYISCGSIMIFMRTYFKRLNIKRSSIKLTTESNQQKKKMKDKDEENRELKNDRDEADNNKNDDKISKNKLGRIGSNIKNFGRGGIDLDISSDRREDLNTCSTEVQNLNAVGIGKVGVESLEEGLVEVGTGTGRSSVFQNRSSSPSIGNQKTFNNPQNNNSSDHNLLRSLLRTFGFDRFDRLIKNLDENNVVENDEDDESLKDLTDLENFRFKYVY